MKSVPTGNHRFPHSVTRTNSSASTYSTRESRSGAGIGLALTKAMSKGMEAPSIVFVDGFCSPAGEIAVPSRAIATGYKTTASDSTNGVTDLPSATRSLSRNLRSQS